MGKFFDEIPSKEIRDWILDQKIFFVASAPLSGDGHPNTSPKGRQTINLVDDKTCWYTDMTGSGNETISHLYEEGNGRITIMFVAFEGPPRIVRFFGKGKVIERGTKEFSDLLPDGDERILNGTRAIIWMDIHKVGTSCGYSVPYFDYSGERLILDEFFEKHEESELDEGKLPTKMRDYWNLKNACSVDGMPGLKNVNDPTKSLEPPFRLHQGGKDAERGDALKTLADDGMLSKGRGESGSTAIVLETWQVFTLLAAAFVMGIIATAGVGITHALYTQRHIRL